jgi:hypothetical protein
MLNKKAINPYLVFDDTDEHYYNNHNIMLDNGGMLSVSPSELIPLSEYQQKMPASELDLIQKSCPYVTQFIDFTGSTCHKGQDDLAVYFKESGPYLIILSTGEFQPGRYKIYLEGIFERVL